MKVHIRERAEGVVRRFEEMLPAPVAVSIEREHYDELILLVEAVIGDVYASTLHDTAKDLEKLAGEYRKQAQLLMEEL